MRSKAAVVMAAGMGTRMKSSLAKVLHPVAGRPMIHYPVRSALELGAERVVLILGHQREEVEAYLAEAFPGAPIATALQAEQLGTAHAVLCAREALADFDGDVFILSGDVPTFPTALIRRLDEVAGDATVGFVSMVLDDPKAYGRVVRTDGRATAIVEARDADAETLAINEVNAGIYRADARFLFETLSGVGSDNAQGEYYLTDLVEAAAESGRGVEVMALRGAEAESANGVNDRVDLASAEARMQRTLREDLMRAGVTLIDPTRVTLHDGVEVGNDTVIEPGVTLLAGARIGSGCVLEQGVRLADTTVGDGTRILAYSIAERADIGANCSIGPFARLREGTALDAGVKIGNFVETKKTHMGEGAKASHLSYLGDAEIGPGANVGAGTITCNYDGKHKHRTEIGAGAFIGSDTQLVAPVKVGDGAYVGAGTTVTGDVPADSLALSRAPQKTIEGWAARKRARQSRES